MATPIVTHAKVTSGTQNVNVEVDLSDWNATHVITGLENVPNVDTSNADNITGGSQTGAGSLVRANSPTLTTPALGTPSALVLTHATGTPASLVLTNATGTPSAITLTNGTGLPVATGISGLGTGVATFLATPSSANLASALTDETGSGAAVFGTSPTLTTPTINSPTITSPTITSANLTGRTPTSATVTISNASPGVITWTAHGLSANTPIFFDTSGSLPTGLSASVPASGSASPNTYLANPALYYIKTVLGANTFTLSATQGGAAINTSSAGSGTHTAYANAMVAAGAIGESIWTTIPISSAFALTTGSAGQVWNSISLTAGVWQLWGNTGVIKTGGTTPTYTHMHSNVSIGLAGISTAPFNGAAAMHVTSNNENGWILANTPQVIFLTGTTTINGVVTADFSGGTCGAYGTLWAIRSA